MNLLEDRIFRVLIGRHIRRMSLPDLFAALGREQVNSLLGLQRHQEDSWHMFLCHVAGAVLACDGSSKTRRSAKFWRDGIRQLTKRSDDAAWTLMVEDVAKPAFMQPPSRATRFFSTFKLKATTPDALDVLQTAKNHDLKSARITDDPELWAFALVSLQTSIGFLGSGNYGIARMNGGWGSRCYVAFVPNEDLGARWRRDVEMLLEIRGELLDPPYPFRQGGNRWLWLLPWDGKTSLSITSLDPFFIEVARRIRLRCSEAGLVAYSAVSTVPRIAAQHLKGNLGDPWIPVDAERQSALTVSSHGFTPGLVRSLLFVDGFNPGRAQCPRDGEAAGWFLGSALVRGKGRTDGFREARVRVPGKVAALLFRGGPARDRLAYLSKWAVHAAGCMEYQVLRFSLHILLKAGPKSIADLGNREVGAWIHQVCAPFSSNWGVSYFNWLWQALEENDDNTVQCQWIHCVRAAAINTLELAIVSMPARAGRRYRARTCARRAFYGSLSTHFGEFLKDGIDAVVG